MFGITENGDASMNYEWESAMLEMDGSILITKKLTPTFKNKVIEHMHRPFMYLALDMAKQSLNQIWTHINTQSMRFTV